VAAVVTLSRTSTVAGGGVNVERAYVVMRGRPVVTISECCEEVRVVRVRN
jgi:hypothetical protein